jgi:aryl-alcohol dehydrogenase-like predicted oxidoreductase
LGRTGLEVTQLGYGTALPELSEGEHGDMFAGELLNAVLDSGINFIDSAPDYGRSEERIGKFVSHRRDEYFLATKCGCNIDAAGVRGEPGHLWSAARLHANIDQSLERLKTDRVDLLQMHNPSFEDVEKGGLVQVLQEIKEAGKTRFIGVSSTAPDLMPFARMGVFDTFQIPYSALERRHESMIQEAADLGAGIIIRVGIAHGHNARESRDRTWKDAGLAEIAGEMGRNAFILRFTLSHPACHTTIVGTGKLDNLAANLCSAQEGALPAQVYERAREQLSQSGEAAEKPS